MSRPVEPGEFEEALTFSGRTVAGRYRILGLLGQGGNAKVYEAEQIGLDRLVAVKVIRADKRTETASKHFMREAKLAGRVSSPHVVTLYDFGRDDETGELYLAMELLEGRSLSRTLREDGALPLDRALDVGAQVARGLAAAHEKGVLHRDLKPANIFLCADGTAKVLDFGIAKLTVPELGDGDDADSLTQDGRFVGTPSYMSPEAATKGPIGPATDIYALGLIVYDMIVGQPAFRSGNPMRTLMAQVKQPAPRVSERVGDVPPELDDFVDALLRKDPATRPQDPMQIAKHLEQLRAVAPLAPDPTVPHVQTRFEAFGAETTEESAATTLWDRDHVRPSFTPPPQQPAPPMAAPPSPKRPSLLPFVLLAVAALFVGALTFALVWAARLWLG